MKDLISLQQLQKFYLPTGTEQHNQSYVKKWSSKVLRYHQKHRMTRIALHVPEKWKQQFNSQPLVVSSHLKKDVSKSNF